MKQVTFDASKVKGNQHLVIPAVIGVLNQCAKERFNITSFSVSTAGYKIRIQISNSEVQQHIADLKDQMGM